MFMTSGNELVYLSRLGLLSGLGAVLFIYHFRMILGVTNYRGSVRFKDMDWVRVRIIFFFRQEFFH